MICSLVSYLLICSNLLTIGLFFAKYCITNSWTYIRNKTPVIRWFLGLWNLLRRFLFELGSWRTKRVNRSWTTSWWEVLWWLSLSWLEVLWCLSLSIIVTTLWLLIRKSTMLHPVTSHAQFSTVQIRHVRKLGLGKLWVKRLLVRIAPTGHVLVIRRSLRGSSLEYFCIFIESL